MKPKKYKKLVRKLIRKNCDDLKALLLLKNKSYGNSVFEPARIFSGSDPDGGIRERIDDKLKRIKNQREQGKPDSEDSELDLLGYVVLLRVWRKLRKKLR